MRTIGFRSNVLFIIAAAAGLVAALGRPWYAKAPVQTIARYDEELLKDAKLPTVSSRPVSSVVQTISE